VSNKSRAGIRVPERSIPQRSAKAFADQRFSGVSGHPAIEENNFSAYGESKRLFRTETIDRAVRQRPEPHVSCRKLQ
jgi:hypothetical protein